MIRGSLSELEELVGGIPGGVCGDGGGVLGASGDQGEELVGRRRGGVASGDDVVAGARAGVTGGVDEDPGGDGVVGILSVEFECTRRIFWLESFTFFTFFCFSNLYLPETLPWVSL